MRLHGMRLYGKQVNCLNLVSILKCTPRKRASFAKDLRAVVQPCAWQEGHRCACMYVCVCGLCVCVWLVCL